MFGHLSSDRIELDSDTDVTATTTAHPACTATCGPTPSIDDAEPAGEAPTTTRPADTAENLTVDLGVWKPVFDLRAEKLEDGNQPPWLQCR